jgi:putative FmdB family regulatory protein
MPIYEYRCERCEEIQEELHGIHEEPAITCSCGGRMRRKPSTFANQDPQLEADRAYDNMSPGEQHLHQSQLKDVMKHIEKGTAGRVKAGKRWPSQLKPKALQTPKN